MRRPIPAFAAVLLWLAGPAFAQDPVQWSVTLDAKRVDPGRTFNAHVTAEIETGWKVYALTQTGGGPTALKLAVARSATFSAAGPVESPLPHSAFDPNFNIETQYHEDRATFRMPIRVAPDAAAGPQTLRIVVSFQTCNDRLCLPPKDVEGASRIEVGARDSSGTPGTSGGPEAGPRYEIPVTSVSSVSPVSPALAPVRDFAAASRASGFDAYLGLAALMGALSLLTPCVFPMVPITVSYFTARAGRSRREAAMQAIVYGLGIVLTFSALGFALAVGFGASGLNQFAANPWLNIGVTALFLGFALSLFGVWQLAIPARLLTAASRTDGRHGRFAGTLLMGLAFTLTSFTCTAPFLGTLLVVAAQGDWQWPLAGMIAFSTVFALPFIGLALAPQLVAALPRSGPWLVAVKTSMGLLELAAAMKFLSNADLVWGWRIFTREVVLVSWLAIAILLVVYLAGVIRIGHSARLGRPGAGRLMAVAASLALGVWLATGLGGRRLGELEAFLPPADLSAATPGGELPWIVNDFDTARAEAARQNRPLLIDFTGYTCTNCRWMEANMFPRPEVSRELARFIRVRLYTDGRGEIYRRHQQLEQDMFGTVALPYYAVLAADGRPTIAFGGLTRSPDEFIAFLREGLEP